MNRTCFHPNLPTAFLLLSVIFLSFATGCYSKKETGRRSEMPVTVRLAKPQVGDVTQVYEMTGHTDATLVTVSPRVRGTLEEICFEPGNIVDEGDVLFKIEQFDYKSRVDNANAECYIARARFDKAQADYNRQVEMDAKGPGITTKDELERAKALLEESRGNIEMTRVKLEQAKKDLERTTITSPCRGKINKSDPSVGDLIDGTVGTPRPMTTIMSMDPLYVYFEISDSEFNEFNAKHIDLVRQALGDRYDPSTPLSNKQIVQVLEEYDIQTSLEFEMRLPGEPEGEFPHKGKITYGENRINLDTGTITLRAEIPNPDYALFPGQICSVRVKGDVIPNAILVEEKALCYDLSDTYIWALDSEGRPYKQLIEAGQRFDGNKRLVTSGLTGDETYIVEGFQSVRSGCAIQDADASPAADAPPGTDTQPGAEQPDSEPSANTQPAAETAE